MVMEDAVDTLTNRQKLIRRGRQQAIKADAGTVYRGAGHTGCATGRMVITHYPITSELSHFGEKFKDRRGQYMPQEPER